MQNGLELERLVSRQPGSRSYNNPGKSSVELGRNSGKREGPNLRKSMNQEPTDLMTFFGAWKRGKAQEFEFCELSPSFLL